MSAVHKCLVMSKPQPTQPPAVRARTAALRLVRQHGYAVSRRELRAAGVPRWFVRNEVARRRWQLLGRHVVVLHNGPVSVVQRRRAAVVEAGERAALDGVCALQAAGLTGLSDTAIEVAAAKGSRPGRLAGATVRESRWYREDDVEVRDGVRVLRPAVAAVHAAVRAKSDRQAALFLVMTVQQGLSSADALLLVLSRIKRRRRVAVLATTLLQIRAGSQSLGELDVVGALRRRGLPVPSQQVVRRGADGREYLDCDFPGYDLVLEIDGLGHREAQQVLKDVLRDLGLLAEGRPVMRISLLAWVTDQEAVLDAIEAVFRARGWAPTQAA